MTDEEMDITFVRASFRESSHSHRRQQLQKALGLLRDKLHVRGLIISQGISGIDLQAEGHFETLGDLLRRVPDPRVVIEFFDEPQVAMQARQLLRENFPEARVLWWHARCLRSDLKAGRPQTATA